MKLDNPFPPEQCTAWEDCNHDGLCHDPSGCGGVGPNMLEEGETPDPIEIDIKPFPQGPWGYADFSHALPCQIVGPTATSHWIVKVPGGRQFELTEDEFNALVPVS